MYTHTHKLTHQQQLRDRPLIRISRLSKKNFSSFSLSRFPFTKKIGKTNVFLFHAVPIFSSYFYDIGRPQNYHPPAFFFPSPHTHTHTLLTPIVPERGNFPPVKVPRRSRAMPSSLPATANSFSVAIYYTQGPGTSFLVILPS